VLFPADRCPAEDLGTPVPHDGIYAVAIDQAADIIYGISYPNGRLFAYKIADKQFNDLGEIDSEISYHGPEREWRSLPRALMVDRGRVFTFGKDGYLVYFDMFKPGLHSTGQRIPGEYYPVQAYTGHPVVEAFTKTADGLIYGATSDGFLFSFNREKGISSTWVSLVSPAACAHCRLRAAGFTLSPASA